MALGVSVSQGKVEQGKKRMPQLETPLSHFAWDNSLCLPDNTWVINHAPIYSGVVSPPRLAFASGMCVKISCSLLHDASLFYGSLI